MSGTPYALVDCNNFYASCERLFAPHLNGKPVVVLSNNDGCVIARSNEAKALGIAMGAPYHLHRTAFQKNGVAVFSSNYALYGDVSARVVSVLRQFTPELEVYSIDESFLNLTGFETRLEEHARDVRRTVLQWTGIPVSIGIAPTKTLAKVVNRLAKKEPALSGVAIGMDVASQVMALGRMGLTDLWGVAGRFERRLRALGIETPLALRDANPDLIRRHFGVVGERLVLELNGIPCQGFVPEPSIRKSIVVSRSFGRVVTSRLALVQAVSRFTERAAEKLRRQRLGALRVTVFARSSPFRPGDTPYTGSKTMCLPVASSDTAYLLRAVAAASENVWHDGIRFAKAGVLLDDLVPADAVQGDLWGRGDTLQSKELMSAVDTLNRRHGRGTVRFAASGVGEPWALRASRRSPRYTTLWSELLAVK